LGFFFVNQDSTRLFDSSINRSIDYSINPLIDYSINLFIERERVKHRFVYCTKTIQYYLHRQARGGKWQCGMRHAACCMYCLRWCPLHGTAVDIANVAKDCRRSSRGQEVARITCRSGGSGSGTKRAGQTTGATSKCTTTSILLHHKVLLQRGLMT